VIRTSFNDDWRFRPKVNAFMGLIGGPSTPWVPVRLPHDAMIGGPRDPDGHGSASYFPGGVWEYQKPFVAPEADRGKRIVVEFEGVYRSAAVYVNGTLVGHRPYGYSNFAVSIGEYLRYGEENTIGVDATAHDDSRWYSGAGIYRNVISSSASRYTSPSTDLARLVRPSCLLDPAPECRTPIRRSGAIRDERVAEYFLQGVGVAGRLPLGAIRRSAIT
jgi:beta-galactosidase